jgi:8-oxo-dGTP pyrophosphatase MutT (NUDIX family)
MKLITFSVKGIVSMGNKVLLIKRSLNHKYCPGCWELPGGKIETLNFKKDFIRELKEEAGLKATRVVYRGILIRRTALYRTILGWRAWHCSFFVAAPGASQAAKLSQEHTDFGWFTPGQVKKMVITPETKYALGKYNSK